MPEPGWLTRQFRAIKRESKSWPEWMKTGRTGRMTADQNCISTWFPRLAAAGVPVPRTRIVRSATSLATLPDGETPEGYEDFLFDLDRAAVKVGTPFFLRTGHTSGKHDWRRTCYVGNPADLAAHVAALVEYSEAADILGLPTSTWAVREFVPLWHTFTAFGGMPVAVERRVFIRDGRRVCDHAYWPPDSIRDPSREDWRQLLSDHDEISKLYDSRRQIRAALDRICPAFDGFWSVDFALARDGRWLAIDMAEGDRSFHWPGCRFDPRGDTEASTP